jgi:SAM-dependent methyltransferase
MGDSAGPNPALFWDHVSAFRRSAAIRAAIDLDIFSAIAEGARTVADIAARTNASARGVRILSDYLAAAGFLIKSDGCYSLTADSALLLDRNSPAYIGKTIEFLQGPDMIRNLFELSEVARSGGLPAARTEAFAAEHPMWIDFARSMQGMMAPLAEVMAEKAAEGAGESLKTLDIAAGHGLFGIAIAKRCPQAHIFAVDWPGVLAVAEENARAAGVGDRHMLIPGDAFRVEFGNGYDLALLTNFFHHFGRESNVSLLRKVRQAVHPGGRVFTLDLVPNDDRVSPPDAAMFGVVMLANTKEGDVYTFSEYDAMFREAGFGESAIHAFPGRPQSLIVTSA